MLTKERAECSRWTTTLFVYPAMSRGLNVEERKPGNHDLCLISRPSSLIEQLKDDCEEMNVDKRESLVIMTSV